MPTDLDGFRETKEQLDSNPLENLWKPDPGTTIVRLLPPTSGWFGDEVVDFLAYEFGRHFFNLSSDEVRVSRCPRDRDQECPACEAAAQDYDDPEVQEMTQWEGSMTNVSVSNRYVMNMLVLEEYDEGIRYYDGNYTIWEQLISIMANTHKPDIMDPVRGRNLEMDIPKQGSNHKVSDIHPDDDTYPQDVRKVLKKAGISQKEFMQDLDGLQEVIPDYASAGEMKSWMSTMGFPQFSSGPSSQGDDLEEWEDSEEDEEWDEEPSEEEDDGWDSLDDEEDWDEDWGDDPQESGEDEWGDEDDEWDDDFGFDGEEPDPIE